ncbi:MAG: NAD(P)H-dependent oxidoreductase [Flavobacteriales bacterium]|nr:NAD(P)H-dependent oxidoreductase [Flavobacteriales bacterium]
MKDNKPLVILGSSRKDSNTRKLLDLLLVELDHDLIDLLDYKIYPYDYSTNYPVGDNFFDIIERVLGHNTIIFATPVYWYSMSGQMKTFFDRFSDLVTVKKDIGRRLKGKRTFLVATGEDKNLPDGFEVPFRLTSQYLDMEFVSVYYRSRNDLTTALTHTDEILDKIETACDG